MGFSAQQHGTAEEAGGGVGGSGGGLYSGNLCGDPLLLSESNMVT